MITGKGDAECHEFVRLQDDITGPAPQILKWGPRLKSRKPRLKSRGPRPLAPY